MTTKHRQPRFKVVRHSLEGEPRHRAALVLDERLWGLEFWTEAQWSAMHPAERPTACFVPGIGYVLAATITDEECEEIRDERQRALEEWEVRSNVTR